MDTFQTQLSLNNHNLFAPSSNWKGIKPQDNLIVGFNIGTFLDDRKIAIDFDWNLSLYNKDIWDGALSIAQLDTSIDDSLDGFIGRTYDENGNPIVSDQNVKVKQGFLEESNVSAIEEMIANIENQRTFELNLKLIKLASQLDEGTASLLRMPGN